MTSIEIVLLYSTDCLAMQLTVIAGAVKAV